MKIPFADMRSAVLLSSAFVLLLVIVESLSGLFQNRGRPDISNSLDVIVLYGFLWLFTSFIVNLATSLIKGLRTGTPHKNNRAGLVARVFVLILIAIIWASILQDQFPCIIGMPNCD